MAICCVQWLLLLVCRVQDGGKGIRFARKPSPATIVDLCSVAGGGLDVGGAIELDVGGAGDEAFDVEWWEGDEVVFIVFVDVEDRVAYLLETVSK